MVRRRGGLAAAGVVVGMVVVGGAAGFAAEAADAVSRPERVVTICGDVGRFGKEEHLALLLHQILVAGSFSSAVSALLATSRADCNTLCLSRTTVYH